MVISQKLQQNRAHGVKGHRKGARNLFLLCTILLEGTWVFGKVTERLQKEYHELSWKHRHDLQRNIEKERIDQRKKNAHYVNFLNIC